TTKLIAFSMNAGLAGYSPERGLPVYNEIAARLRALPGVSSAALSDAGPISRSNSSTNVGVEGYVPKDDENTDCRGRFVGPDYFRTLGTPLLQGREFDDRDVSNSPRVAIVNQKFLRRFLGGQHAVGRHMSMGQHSENGVPIFDITIVGEVADS